MRTTIKLDDELYRQVKVKAARSGRPAAEVIEDAIRGSLVTPDEPRGGLPPLPTFGRGGLMPGVDLTDNATTRELLDEGVPVDARR
ncbi:MAG TPA: CopG family transcriptional regulator [Acidimicrobiales bacterium]|nr:CopG family transcriptional regulator [Acidimicrobiales bacterium]